MRDIRRSLKNIVVLVGLCLLAGVIGAQAASLSVTNTADAGSGSLRQAIIDATTNAAANIVTISIPTSDPGYDPVENRFTIDLLTPLPDIPLAPLSISNNQPHEVTVNGNGTFRIFTLVNSAVLTIDNLSITNGFANNGLGGGIYMGDSSTMTLNGTIVSNNIAAANGGGIYMSNSGTLHLNQSNIRDNQAINGGGIFIFDSGTLNIDSSTINSNTAISGGNGGGIFNGTSGTINATSNTIDGNAAANFGGGIYNTATMTLTNNTISSNTAAVEGGGIYNGFTATLQNNLVALNTAATSNDLFGTYAGSYNLIGNADGSTGLGSAPNRSGTTANPLDPLLGPLQDNGGPTYTRALLNESPAIDKGNSATIITDQRGLPRPFDNPEIPNDGGNGSDIGAFEVQTIGTDPTPSPTPTVSPSPTPTVEPSPTPTVEPSPTPTVEPSPTPTVEPSPTPPQPTSVQFSSTGYIGNESSSAVVTVTRTGDLSGASSVMVTSSNGTGIGGASCSLGVDYVNVSEVVTFAPTVTSQMVNITLCLDNDVEPIETLNITLSGPAGTLTGAPSSAVVMIANNDPAATAAGFEGDINRPAPGVPSDGTNGQVTIADQIQLQRFLSGADCPTVTPNEQQRADIGPRDFPVGGDLERGNGMVESSDETVMDLYVRQDPSVDFDPNTPGFQLTPAGGPTAITNLGCTPASKPLEAFLFGALAAAGPDDHRVYRIVSGAGDRGSTVVIEVEGEFHGDEAGTQFSLDFNPNVATLSGVSGVNANPDVTLGAGAPAGTTLNVNATQVGNGHIGVVVNFHGNESPPQTIPQGTRRIVRFTFHVTGTAPFGPSDITFSDSVLPQETVDAGGFPLAATYQNGTLVITVLGPTSASVSITGRVVTKNGAGIRGASVILVDSEGNRRSVTTSSLGYYEIAGIEAGQTYVVTGAAKRFRFQARTITVDDSLTEVNLVGID